MIKQTLWCLQQWWFRKGEIWNLPVVALDVDCLDVVAACVVLSVVACVVDCVVGCVVGCVVDCVVDCVVACVIGDCEVDGLAVVNGSGLSRFSEK